MCRPVIRVGCMSGVAGGGYSRPKLLQPGGGNTVSVSALGHVSSGNTRLLLLYLPDGRGVGWPKFQAKDDKT